MTNLARSFRKRFDKLMGREPGWFLNTSRGVVHIGANTGQERELYAQFDLDVLWIEPITSVFAELTANIAAYPKQKALQALLTDKSGETVTFHIASNNGAASSILPLKQATEIWSDLHYVGAVEMVSMTLPDLVANAGVDISKFNTLIMDTQGSELLVMRGAQSMLNQFDIIHTEVADFESYEGCCLLSEVSDYLKTQGFVELHRSRIVANRKVGTYYDVTYKRVR